MHALKLQLRTHTHTLTHTFAFQRDSCEEAPTLPFCSPIKALLPPSSMQGLQDPQVHPPETRRDPHSKQCLLSGTNHRAGREWCVPAYWKGLRATWVRGLRVSFNNKRLCQMMLLCINRIFNACKLEDKIWQWFARFLSTEQTNQMSDRCEKQTKQKIRIILQHNHDKLNWRFYKLTCTLWLFDTFSPWDNSQLTSV